MTPRNLFIVILKIFGLFFLREIVITIPQLFSYFFYLAQPYGMKEGFVSIALTGIILIFYGYIVYLLLFRTNDILNKLKIAEGFDQEEFTFNISASKILTIALLVTAGVILIIEVPNLCRQLFVYFQQKRMIQGIGKPDLSYSIISVVKIIIGLLLIGERRRIISFLQK